MNISNPIHTGAVLLGPPSIERESLAARLEQEFGMVVHCHTTDESDLENLLRTGSIGLAMIMVSGLGMNGRQILATLQSFDPRPNIIVYGTFGQMDAQRWWNSGCDGIISRDLNAEDFLRAVEFVQSGSSFVSPAIMFPPENSETGCAFLGTCGWGLPLIDTLATPFFMVQNDRLVYINAPAQQCLGYSLASAAHLAFHDLVAEQQRDWMRQMLHAWRLRQGYQESITFAVQSQSRGLVWLNCKLREVTVANAPALTFSAMDVSELLESVPPEQLLRCTPAQLAQGGNLRGLIGQHLHPVEVTHEASAAASALTARQRQVLERIASGATNKQIATHLHISEATVKLHVHRLMRILGAENRVAAIRIAREHGLLTY